MPYFLKFFKRLSLSQNRESRDVQKDCTRPTSAVADKPSPSAAIPVFFNGQQSPSGCNLAIKASWSLESKRIHHKTHKGVCSLCSYSC